MPFYFYVKKSCSDEVSNLAQYLYAAKVAGGSIEFWVPLFPMGLDIVDKEWGNCIAILFFVRN